VAGCLDVGQIVGPGVQLLPRVLIEEGKQGSPVAASGCESGVEGLGRAGRLLARHGYGKALVIGRFVPMLRTVVHPAASALGVPARTFTFWHGALLRSQSLVLAGYVLGSSVSHVDDDLLPLVAVVLSLLPLPAEARRAGRRRGGRPPKKKNIK
jgi:membrane-associated protein